MPSATTARQSVESAVSGALRQPWARSAAIDSVSRVCYPLACDVCSGAETAGLAGRSDFRLRSRHSARLFLPHSPECTGRDRSLHRNGHALGRARRRHAAAGPPMSRVRVEPGPEHAGGHVRVCASGRRQTGASPARRTARAARRRLLSFTISRASVSLGPFRSSMAAHCEPSVPHTSTKGIRLGPQDPCASAAHAGRFFSGSAVGRTSTIIESSQPEYQRRREYRHELGRRRDDWGEPL